MRKETQQPEDWQGPPGPPWAWRGDWRRRRNWHRQRRHLFMRFAMTFGLIVLLVVGGMGTLAYLLTRLAGGGPPVAGLVWLGGMVLVVLLPVLAVRVALRASRRITTPLADVMEAADAVAAGNLATRVPVRGPGEFGQLAASFNHMAAELERADRLRRDLTADVAHELRTPLHIIQGNLEGILDGVYEPTAEHVAVTLEETRALARLVEDLRTLSLAEAGRLPLQTERVNVAELLADSATSFGGQAEAAGVELRVETVGNADELTITADAGRLDQVLANLLANALRHTGRDGAITLHAEPAQGGGVRIVVADTGEGIRPDELPYIFERFWRGDPARSPAGGAGSGLGLTIARQLVQAHGGTISAQSTLGQGTRFTVELPGQAKARA